MTTQEIDVLIKQNITNNDTGDITGAILQTTLCTMNAKPIAETDLDSDTQAKLNSVPEWAKEPSKPIYTAQEVGALPDSTVIPGTVAELADASSYALKTEIPTAVAQLSDASSYALVSSLSGYAQIQTGVAGPFVAEAAAGTYDWATTYYKWQKIGDYVFVNVLNAHCISGWIDVHYELPIAPEPTYGASGLCVNAIEGSSGNELIKWDLGEINAKRTFHITKLDRTAFNSGNVINVVIVYRFR